MNNGKAGKLKNLFYDFLIIAGAALLLWGGGNALFKYLGEEKDKELYEQLNENFVNRPTESEDEISIVWGADEGVEEGASTIWYRQSSVDFDGLNAINQEVVGWLFFENEDISYPILYSGDNDYYLHRTLYKEYSESGSIFLEAGNSPELRDRLTIIYGHNMKNGSMFGRLRYYKEIEKYYEDHQYFQILTEDGRACRYRVFSYFDVDQYEVEMVDVESYSTESSEMGSAGRTAADGADDCDEDDTGKSKRKVADNPDGDEEGRSARNAADNPDRDEAVSTESTETDRPDEDGAGSPERNVADKVDVAGTGDTDGNTVSDPDESMIEYTEGNRTEETEEKSTGEDRAEEPEGEYEKYLAMLQERSLILTNVPVGAQDRVVGLYTCSSDQGNRLSVYGVLESEHDFNEILEESLDIRTLDR